jgi:hypothetical protein
VGTSRLKVGQHPVGLSIASSALYEPLLRVGAKVIERHHLPHYYPELSFVLPGLDAAVGPGDDLKVMNEAPIPFLIDARLESGRLSLELRSVQQPPFRVELRTGKVAKVPFRNIYQKSPIVPPQQQIIDRPGIEGLKVRVYRTYYAGEEGRKDREELVSTDEYSRRDQFVRVWKGFVPPKEEHPVEEASRPRPRPTPSEEPPPPAAAPTADDTETDEEEAAPEPAAAAEERRAMGERSSPDPVEEPAEEENAR